MSFTWDGKTYQEWIEQIKNGNASERSDAVYAIREMFIHTNDVDDKVTHQIGLVLADATHDVDTSVRVRAYGAIGLISKFLVADLAIGKNSNRRSVTLRKLLNESKALHMFLIESTPIIVDHLCNKTTTLHEEEKRVAVDAILARLENEKATTKDHPDHNQAVEDAINKIRAMD